MKNARVELQGWANSMLRQLSKRNIVSVLPGLTELEIMEETIITASCASGDSRDRFYIYCKYGVREKKEEHRKRENESMLSYAIEWCRSNTFPVVPSIKTVDFRNVELFQNLIYILPSSKTSLQWY